MINTKSKVCTRSIKNTILIFLTSFFHFPLIQAQIIEDFDPGHNYKEVTLSSPNEIDSFFRSQSNPSFIEGHVTLEGPEIIDLMKFSHVRFITGYLELKNTNVTDLKGLDNLEGCMEFYIEDNKNLLAIDGLSNLKQLHTFVCRSNQKLKSIDIVFPNMLRFIIIFGNNELESICCFDSIRKAESMFFHFNPKLSAIPTFPNLEEVVMRLSIVGNDTLRNISGLENLKRIGGSLFIAFNKSLLTIEHLYSIEYIGKMELSFNDVLEHVNRLENLHTIANELDITKNPALTGIDALLPALKPGSKITITSNENLTHCLPKKMRNWREDDVMMYGNGKKCSVYSIKFKE